ncbi:MAG: hypothetical protein QOE45_650 [Frankiaceae bacterium]|jgi:hypothetical protein|nr:hypothetical protein [Frankiaceae bacterium]
MTPRSLVLGAALLLAAATAGVPARAAAPHVTGLKASASSGTVTLSGWATFSGAVIATRADPANNAGPTGTASGADLIGADVVYRPELADLFVRLRLVSIPTTGASVVGDPTVLYGLRTTIGGVPIEVRVQSLGATALFGLFTCASENGCLPAGDLLGGYGTTGPEIVVSLPISVLAAAKIKLKEGDRIATPIAYTARTSYAAGAITPETRLNTLALTSQPTVTVPVKSVRATVGSVTKAATLKNGTFTVVFPRSAFHRNPDTVTTRTCLGSACAVERFTVHV